MIGVYAIVHRETGRRYIGSSKNIERRWYEHTRLLGMGKHRSLHIQHAWSRYGASAFEFVVLETCDVGRDGLFAREQWWLDAARSSEAAHGFNISSTASLPTQTPDSIKRSADKRRGQKRPGVGAKVAAALRGRKLGKDHPFALGHWKGKHRSIEQCEAQSARQLGRPFSADRRAALTAAMNSESVQLHIRGRHWSRSANAEQVIARINQTKAMARANVAPPKEDAVV